MDKLNVFYACSDKYAPFAGVSMMSIFMSNTDLDDITVYVFGDKISDVNTERMQRTAEKYNRKCVFLDAETEMKRIKDELGVSTFRKSYVIYGRVFCADYMPDDVDRVIAFDSDTIIAKSLRPLLEMDMQGNCVAMVQDPMLNTVQLNTVHYNSGVTMFDVRRWREEGWHDKIVEFMARPDKPALADQGILNETMHSTTLRLPLKYNYITVHRVFSDKTYYKNAPPEFYSLEEMAEARKDPVVLHLFQFLGTRPWNKGSLHPDKEVFDEYLAKSLWSDYERESPLQGLKYTVERCLYRILPEKLFYKVFLMAQDAVMRKTRKKGM